MTRILFATLITSTLIAAPVEHIWLTHASNDPSKIVINWETDTPGNSLVEFGTNAALGNKVSVSEQVTLHHVEIPLESRDTLYHYRVSSGDDVSPVYRFKGYPSSELRLAMVGDWGFAKGKDLTSLTKDDPHLLITLGDNVPDLHGKGREGTKAFSALIDEHRELFRTTPLMPILGNHDREITPRGPKPPAHSVYDVEATSYREFFALPGVEWHWRFDIPDFKLRLLALDASHTKDQGTTWQTNHPITKGSEQHQWFANEVAKTNAEFIITLNNEQNSLMRGYDNKAWLPLFEQTSAVVTGYGYFAERADFNGLPYYNTCLKGDGDLYKDPHSRFSAREDHYLLFTIHKGAPTITAEFKNLQGKVLDASEIAKRR
ncbi:MAG: metallophosphoesterase [Verrucomicrobiaceae bacterium]|nr:metallophosphoesterase [Verrucomicrobiaceae bacterium]